MHRKPLTAIQMGAAFLVMLHIVSSAALVVVMLEVRHQRDINSRSYSEAIRAMSIALCGNPVKIESKVTSPKQPDTK